MSPDQAAALVKKLKLEIESLQNRRDIAESTAKTLESRNKSVLESIERDGNARKRFLLEDAEAKLEQLNQQIVETTHVRDSLLDEVAKNNARNQELSEQIDLYLGQKTSLLTDISDTNHKLAEMDDQLLNFQTEIKDYRGKSQDLRNEIGQLERQRAKGLEDKVALEAELNNVSAAIVQADTDFKSHKDSLQKQINQTQAKLAQALADLTETTNQDKAIREDWANQEVQLEKRMAVVRRGEAKLSDVQKRVEEYENFMRL